MVRPVLCTKFSGMLVQIRIRIRIFVYVYEYSTYDRTIRRIIFYVRSAPTGHAWDTPCFRARNPWSSKESWNLIMGLHATWTLLFGRGAYYGHTRYVVTRYVRQVHSRPCVTKRSKRRWSRWCVDVTNVHLIGPIKWTFVRLIVNIRTSVDHFSNGLWLSNTNVRCLHHRLHDSSWLYCTRAQILRWC